MLIQVHLLPIREKSLRSTYTSRRHLNLCRVDLVIRLLEIKNLMRNTIIQLNFFKLSFKAIKTIIFSENKLYLYSALNTVKRQKQIFWKRQHQNKNYKLLIVKIIDNIKNIPCHAPNKPPKCSKHLQIRPNNE